MIHESKVGDLFYRIEDKLYSYTIDAETESYGSQLVLEGRSYVVVKVTKCGVWLDVQASRPRFVCLTATKQFAHATQEGAIKGFQARKKCQQRIYQSRVDRAARAHKMADTFTKFRPPVPPPSPDF